MPRSRHPFELTCSEAAVFARLRTPRKIQDFLETIPVNFETGGDTCISPRRVLREKKAHCMEGALFAAAALWYHGERPLILDLKSAERDVDHVVALFRREEHWGAISKTNHAVLRYREPVYRTIRELALSYFHEYFLDDGVKTMRSYSKPFDLSRFANRGWVTAEEDVLYLPDLLDSSPHISVLTSAMRTGLRRADKIEIEAGKLVEWPQPRSAGKAPQKRKKY